MQNAPEAPGTAAPVDAEIQRAAEAFPEPLPAGVRWPRTGIDFSDPAVNPEQAGVVPHAGMNDEFVAGYWLCSWMDVYLTSLDDQDPGRRNEAVSTLGRYTSLPVVKQNLGNPEHFDAEIVDRARRGDSTRVEDYYRSSCRHYERER